VSMYSDILTKNLDLPSLYRPSEMAIVASTGGWTTWTSEPWCLCIQHAHRQKPQLPQSICGCLHVLIRLHVHTLTTRDFSLFVYVHPTACWWMEWPYPICTRAWYGTHLTNA
jgi:hypothetical protein